MPRRKAKFIDKRQSVTWHLFDRPLDDVACGDATMPQVALVEVDRRRRQRERERFGIFYDDDYDYMQHLKPRSGRRLTVVAGDEGDEGDEDDGDGDGDGDEGEAKVVGEFSLPTELLPNESAPPYGAGVGAYDDEFFDPEIAAALDAADEDEGDGDGEGDDEGIEDDFVSLAQRPPSAEAAADAAASKRDIFDRFFGDEAPAFGDGDGDAVAEAKRPAASVSVASSRRRRPLTYHEEVVEEQFDRLLREFQRDADDPEAAEADGDVDAASTMTKSLSQALRQHEAERAAAVVGKRRLDEGRLPTEDTLRCLRAIDEDDDGDGEGDGEEAEDSDVDEVATAKAKAREEAEAAAARRREASLRNRPRLLKLADPDADGDGDGDEEEEEEEDDDDDDDDDDSDSGDDESRSSNPAPPATLPTATTATATATATVGSVASLQRQLAGVEDKRERKRLVKLHRRQRREQRSRLRREFAKAKADAERRERCAEPGGRTLRL